MKKFLLILLCLAMLLATASCNKSDDVDSNNTETTKAEGSSNDNTEASKNAEQRNNEQSKEILEAIEKYKKTLYDFINGITHEMVYWPDLNSDLSLSFAIVDMNGDLFPEVIVEKSDEHALLYVVNNEKHLLARDFGFRDMYYIMKDGTFYWNSTSNVGHEYGASKLIIYDTYCRVIDLWTIRNDGTDDTEFFVLGNSVTEKEFDAFESQFSDDRVDFYDLTVENIEKYITLENFAR